MRTIETIGMKWTQPVAEALGHGWLVDVAGWVDDPQRDAARLLGPDGIRLYVDISGTRNGRGRVEIRWDIDPTLKARAADPAGTRKKITVAFNRPPSQVAGEITRRLLPGLVELQIQLAQRLSQHLTEKEDQADYLVHVATLLRERVAENEVKFSRYLGNHRYEYYGSVEYRAGYDMAKLKLELSPENMLAVIEFLAQRFVQTNG